MSIESFPSSPNKQSHGQLSSTERSGHSQELGENLLPQSDRIVVFGTRSSGAGLLALALEESLKNHGVEGRIDFTRHVHGIRDVFFSRFPQDTSDMEHPQITSSIDSSPASSEPALDPFYDTRPRGVIIFPEMRHVDPSGYNVTVSGHVPGIVELCESNSVPYIIAGESTDIEDISRELSSSLPSLESSPDE